MTVIEEYVDLGTMDIVTHTFLERARVTYKNSRFTDAELAGMNAASFEEPAQPKARRTGKAKLIGGKYVREYVDKPPAQIVSEAKQARDAERVAPIEVTIGGVPKLFDLDQASQTNIREVLDNWDIAEAEMIAQGYTGPAGTIPWTIADNTDIQVTQADLLKVRQEGIKRAIQLHFQYKAIKAANQ